MKNKTQTKKKEDIKKFLDICDKLKEIIKELEKK